MTQFFQQIANGTILGAQYALIAIGYTMVYGIIQLINFAHGEIFMVGAFGGFTAYTYVLPAGLKDNVFIALPVMLLFGVAFSVTCAVLMERFAYRPLRHAPRLAPLITAIGVSIFLQELVRKKYPHAISQLAFPPLLPEKRVHIGGVSFSYVGIFVLVVALVLMVSLQSFVRRSRTGRAMRATAQDPDTARLMGVDTDRIIVITFILGATLAAAAGIMQGMFAGSIDYRIGFIGGLKAFTAAVLGGIGNITGAVLGGFTLGIVEALATQYIPGGSGLKDVWAFIVLIGVLLFRPTGLLGESVRSRS